VHCSCYCYWLSWWLGRRYISPVSSNWKCAYRCHSFTGIIIRWT